MLSNLSFSKLGEFNMVIYDLCTRHLVGSQLLNYYD